MIVGYATLNATSEVCQLAKVDINTGNLIYWNAYKPTEPTVVGCDWYAMNVGINGGYILAGFYSTVSLVGDHWALMARVSENGTTLWDAAFGSAGTVSWIYAVIPVSDGYIFAGYSTSCTSGGEDVMLGKITENGTLLWWNSFGQSANDVAYGHCVIQDSNGDFVLVGETDSSGAGGEDFLVMKIAGNGGSVIWSFTFGGSGTDYVWRCCDLPV